MKELVNLGNGLSIVQVNINMDIREQDLNARIMSKKMFSQLVSNIKKRGGLESLPYCVMKDGQVEIVSGHHRIRACRVAGIIEIPVLLDTTEMTRSQIVAKQLAHNSLTGTDDKDILVQLYEMMDSIDDKLESYVNIDELTGEGTANAILVDLDEKVNFKSMTFLFTEKEFDDVDKLLERLQKEGADHVRLADIEQFDKLVAKLEQVKKAHNVKNSSVAMHLLVEEYEDKHQGDDN